MGQDYVCLDSHFAMEVRMLKLLTQMLTLMTRSVAQKDYSFKNLYRGWSDL